jgi:hypothetical protein
MKKARMCKLNVKAMIIVLFDIRGIIMIEWVPEGPTVNQKYYLEVLTKLRERVRKRLWKKKSWVLHEDNTPAHNALAIKQFLANKCIPVLKHFTGFSPLWFLPVRQTESPLKGTHFRSVNEVTSKTAYLLIRVSADGLQALL